MVYDFDKFVVVCCFEYLVIVGLFIGDKFGCCCINSVRFVDDVDVLFFGCCYFFGECVYDGIGFVVLIVYYDKCYRLGGLFVGLC